MKHAFETFGDLYRDGIRSVLETGRHVEAVTDPASIGSNFGASRRAALETVPYLATVLDPSRTIIWSKFRQPRLSYCIGLLLWTLAGSRSLPWISYYNSRAEAFSDDGRTLRGAFGSRLMSRSRGRGQVDMIVGRLSRDPATRRAVGVILQIDDVMADSRDTPCAIAVQYLLREGRLESIVYMRSQSAALVFVYDAFLFSSMQQLIATRLGVSLGPLHLVAGSFHIYDDELEVARRIQAHGVETLKMSPMSANPDELEGLLAFERGVRVAARAANVRSLEKLTHDLPVPVTFEDEARILLAAVAHLKCGRADTARQHVGRLRPELQVAALSELERGQ
jgi:thymidylate synthase